MGAAEVIAFEEVRARKQWDALRGQLHIRFAQWLERLDEQLQEARTVLSAGDRDRVASAPSADRQSD